MSDLKHRRGPRDRATVAAKQPYEVRDLAKKVGCTQEQVLEAIKAVGNNRKDILSWLREKGYML